MRLRILSAVRWFKENFIVWSLLTVIYSVTVTLILQPLLGAALKRELEFKPLWIATWVALAIPAVFDRLPQPRSIAIPAAWFRSIRSSIRPYLIHEFRRPSTWILIFAAGLGGAFLPAGKRALWILLLMFPSQRALFSLSKWIWIFHSRYPKSGAQIMHRAFLTSQLLQSLVAWVVFSLAIGSLADASKLGLATLGATLGACAVCLEGDSARPWMVNFIALAGGILGGYLVLAHWSFLLVVGYAWHSLNSQAAQRLKSVEHFDEDLIIP